MPHIDPTSLDYEPFRLFQSALRDKIKSIRLQKGLTQLDVAECGISLRHYERLEQDPTAIVSLWQLFRLARFYDIDIADLVVVET